MVPPQKVLWTLIERSGFGQIELNTVVSSPSIVAPPDPESTEGKLLHVLDEFGPVMDGEELAEKCVEAGMNATTFYVYRSNSPVISALGKGIYCKVGSEVPPGTIEAIVNRRRSTPRVSDHGWTSNGCLWFGLELSLLVITAGSIRLVPFVGDLVQGEWTVRLPDGGEYGVVKCKDVFIRTFRRAFSVLGVEPGDFVALEFDTKSRHVTLRAGGPELFESMQSPEAIEIGEADDDA
jgi:hypothetical protein